MTDLARFQEGFASHLMGDQELPPGLAGSKESQQIRLRVYRNNVFYSLTTALGDLYPVIKQLVGEEFFRHLARQYLLKCAPNKASMVHLGGDFPTYLERDELKTGLAYLADVARLELARHQAFHAKDCKALEPEMFQQLGVGYLLGCRLSLHPSLRLLKSRWAVHSIWAAHQAEQVNLERVQLDKSEAVLILRPETEPKIYTVELALIDFLHLIDRGVILSFAVEETLANHSNFDAGTALAFCINQGVFSEFHSDK